MKLLHKLSFLGKLFKKKEEPKYDFDLEDLKKIKKKNRKKAIRLYEEYQKGLVIQLNKDINQKDLMLDIRKNN